MTEHAPSFDAIIAHHSKSFALASKLLPRSIRREALVLYAYCRRADDAVDLAPVHQQRAALRQLQDELDVVYSLSPPGDPVARAFQVVVRTRAIPREIPADLLAGMEMDVLGTRYADWSDLELYCYRVAGTVGLMMCRVMGVHDLRALRHAADLGIAMQLTNICRDVLEDWQRDRLYLPADLLEESNAASVSTALGSPLPRSCSPALQAAIGTVLTRADDYYASGDAGLSYLPLRCRLAVRTARLVYSSIGDALRLRGCDPWRGRAIVPRAKKLLLVMRAATETYVSQRPCLLREPVWQPPAS